MLINRKKPNSDTPLYVDVVNTIGNQDYVKDGKVHKNAPTSVVLVASQSDLNTLTGYETGTIAYTAGFANIWQLNASGEWVEV